jgi:hypothetical protein
MASPILHIVLGRSRNEDAAPGQKELRPSLKVQRYPHLRLRDWLARELAGCDEAIVIVSTASVVLPWHFADHVRDTCTRLAGRSWAVCGNEGASPLGLAPVSGMLWPGQPSPVSAIARTVACVGGSLLLMNVARLKALRIHDRVAAWPDVETHPDVDAFLLSLEILSAGACVIADPSLCAASEAPRDGAAVARALSSSAVGGFVSQRWLNTVFPTTHGPYVPNAPEDFSHIVHLERSRADIWQTMIAHAQPVCLLVVCVGSGDANAREATRASLGAAALRSRNTRVLLLFAEDEQALKERDLQWPFLEVHATPLTKLADLLIAHEASHVLLLKTGDLLNPACFEAVSAVASFAPQCVTTCHVSPAHEGAIVERAALVPTSVVRKRRHSLCDLTDVLGFLESVASLADVEFQHVERTLVAVRPAQSQSDATTLAKLLHAPNSSRLFWQQERQRSVVTGAL